MKLAQVIKKYSSTQKGSTTVDSIGQKDAMQLHFPHKHASLIKPPKLYSKKITKNNSQVAP